MYIYIIDIDRSQLAGSAQFCSLAALENRARGREGAGADRFRRDPIGGVRNITNTCLLLLNRSITIKQ